MRLLINLRMVVVSSLLLGLCHVCLSELEIKTYIVHLAKSQMPETYDYPLKWYQDSLRQVSDTAQMIYTYTSALHGYATRLTEHQAEALALLPGVLTVLPETRYELHTTRTPSFLGLNNVPDALLQSSAASDVIIGVLDTGVWPESKSFDDTGFGPVPSTWRGTCQAGANFSASSCNKKLIGAQYFSQGYEAIAGMLASREPKSPRDEDGHGTHTASTAAGSPVEGASLFGYAPGTARGMAPKARVAVYKVCWKGGCFSSDILKAIDKAIEDNVNVLSLSLGGGMSDYYKDSVAIGAFAAMEHGILVSCSAGNAGPNAFSLSNVAPWITTVGAGTIDRDFPASASTGDGKTYYGVSLYRGESLPRNQVPIVYAGNATNVTGNTRSLCMANSLIPEKVKDKIVFCDRGISPRIQKGAVVKAAGGIGMILANTEANGEELVADAHLLPATIVGQKNGDVIRNYVVSNPNPTATILFEGTKVGIQPSPVVAAFSSRGPNGITPNILKPDMIAPGVNILAAWSEALGPTTVLTDTRRVQFNIISGTSMSCPHVSGLAGLVKGVHPDWSPAAIRSALMTTAYNTYKNGEMIKDVATGKPSTPLDHGAGHVDPVSALNPGLVYDLTPTDYLEFLCALGYTSSQIRLVARRSFACDSKKKYSITDFNYPSFAVSFKTAGPTANAASAPGNGTNVMKFTRTLTNVGPPGSYKVSVKSQATEVKISVEPEVLSFSKMNDKKPYTVTFTAEKMMPLNTYRFARIEWSDGKHVVGSPVAINWS